MKNEIRVSEKKDDAGMDEWWCRWFRCPDCKEVEITSCFKFCPNCGKKIKWVK